MAKQSMDERERLVLELDAITDTIATMPTIEDPRIAKRTRLKLESLSDRISALAEKLDPVTHPRSIFDPTDPDTAGRIVALTLVAQERRPLAKVPDFYGAGVYAIYYNGSFPLYAPLSGKDHPLYIGKADPKDPSAKDAVGQGTKLSSRLKEHARNIAKATSTLDIADFECRFLIVQTGYQKAAEDYLINFFQPIWNNETDICFGLGKHGDNAKTRANKRSPWDTLHPGRTWAADAVENQKSPEEIQTRIREHFTTNPPYRNLQTIFDHFVSSIRQLDIE